MQFSGKFIKPNLTSRDIKDEDIVWEKASILVRTSNLKGIKNEVNFNIGNQSYAFETNYTSKRTKRKRLLLLRY